MNRIFTQLKEEVTASKLGDIIGLSYENAIKLLESYEAMERKVENLRKYYRVSENHD